eukprot:symbB.v1.2.025296.t1/scaffold2445.1/size151041/24
MPRLRYGPIIGGISLKIHPEGGKHEGTLNGKSLFVKTRVQCRLVCSLLTPTYRCNRSQDPNGARIHDTRNDGCIVEMLGKKKWVGHQSHDPLVARLPNGDPKLYHLSQSRILPELDEENRELRKNKQGRTDTHIPETRTPLRPKDRDRTFL